MHNAQTEELIADAERYFLQGIQLHNNIVNSL